MMMRKIITTAAVIAAALLPVGCGHDIEVVSNLYDSVGEVFLEQGKRHKATTQFTDAEMLDRLCAKRWRRSYAFYYDRAKAGKRDELQFAGENYYEFEPDGTALLGNVSNPRERVDYTYTSSGRDVTLRADGQSWLLRVVAIDDTLLITDTPMTGQPLHGYDDATARQRTVFTATRK